MPLKEYDKQPTSIQDQVNLLKSRNLHIEDEIRVRAYLSRISYYRLSGYFLPYQKIKDKFNDGVTFDAILNTYLFDRELRLLIFDSIERIEIALRTQIVQRMATKYNDSHWHDDENLFESYKNMSGERVDPWSDFQKTIGDAMKAKKPEVFIKHYIDKYDKPVNPPCWMCFELLTIGELSRLFHSLKKNEDKKTIADFFQVHPTVFTSWLHSLTYVRNICAHHSRLWNKELAISPDILLKPVGPWIGKPFENNKRLFYFLSVLKYLLNRANQNNTLRDKITTLIAKYKTVPIAYLGIPSDGQGSLLNWEEEPIWTT